MGRKAKRAPVGEETTGSVTISGGGQSVTFPSAEAFSKAAETLTARLAGEVEGGRTAFEPYVEVTLEEIEDGSFLEGLERELEFALQHVADHPWELGDRVVDAKIVVGLDKKGLWRMKGKSRATLPRVVSEAGFDEPRRLELVDGRMMFVRDPQMEIGDGLPHPALSQGERVSEAGDRENVSPAAPTVGPMTLLSWQGRIRELGAVVDRAEKRVEGVDVLADAQALRLGDEYKEALEAFWGSVEACKRSGFVVSETGKRSRWSVLEG